MVALSQPDLVKLSLRQVRAYARFIKVQVWFVLMGRLPLRACSLRIPGEGVRARGWLVLGIERGRQLLQVNLPGNVLVLQLN